MHKIALFLEKKKQKKLENHRSIGGSAPNPVGLRQLGVPPPDPRVVTPITCYTYFLEDVCSVNVITFKKEQKELRNINNVLLLPLISYFKLCAGYPSSATGSDFSAL